MSTRDRSIRACGLFLTVPLSLVLSSCLDDGTETLLAPAPELRASLSGSDGSTASKGRGPRSAGSLAGCITLAVAEGERLEDQGASAAATWQHVTDDVAACRDQWGPK